MKILQKARVLFNENGVSETKLRTIANGIGISQGNLNYHYKKREEILIALYFEMVEVFDERLKRTAKVELSLELIYRESRASMERMFEYRFIWLDLRHLLKENKSIRSHFSKAQKDREKGALYAFRSLESRKLFRKEHYEGEFEQLAIQLTSFANFWLCSADLKYLRLNKKIIDEYHEVYFNILNPFLTAKGQRAKSSFLLQNNTHL